MRYAFLLCSSLGLAACLDTSSDCSTGPAYCEGNAAYHCVGGCPWGSCQTRWEVSECDADQVCLDLGLSALCVLSATPDVGCESKRRPEYCDDDRIVSCADEYATHILDCSATGRTCTDQLPQQCVESATRDPRCPDAFHGAVCDGDHKLECMGGYLTRDSVCEAGCIVPEGFYQAMCIHPDSAALCAPENLPTPQTLNFCVDDALFFCHEGLALEIVDCALEDGACRQGWDERYDDGCEPLPR